MIAQRVEAIWRGETSGSRLARAALAPLSYLFAGAVRARSALYDKEWLAAERTRLPVISVGNLRVGGTGKTPTVLWLVSKLRVLGVRPVVAMRGYGARRAGESIWLEPDDHALEHRTRTLLPAGFRVVGVERGEQEPSVSDEALLVALRGEVAVASNPNRIAAARAAHAVGADVLVLDDGFQHRRLHRDLDIVLTQRSERAQHVLPSGPLREPWEALARAAVVLAPDEVVAPGASTVVRSHLEAIGWVHRVAAATPVAALETWRGREVVAVAGIARPERFFDMLCRCGVQIRERRVFVDHHRYTREEWEKIRRSLRSGECVVTTEKDLVKLHALAGDDEKLAALRVEMQVEPEGDVLRLVRAAIPRLDASRRGPHDR